jgi:transposase
MMFPQLGVVGGNPVNRIPFVRHLPVGKLRYKYRACRHPVEKVRWHAVWLLARTDEPRTPVQVAAIVGLSDVTVRAVLHRWNASGPAGLADGRRGNGSAPKLTPRRRDALYAALQKRPPDGGVWTGPKVARYVEDRWGVEVGPVTAWRWLRDLGFTLQVPRPSHPKSATPTARRAWKKTCDGG